MYLPNVFEENRVEVLHELMRTYPLGTLVTLNDDGLQANHIPFEVQREPEPFGTLYAHVARANPVWRELSRNHDVLAIFQGPQAYISPSIELPGVPRLVLQKRIRTANWIWRSRVAVSVMMPADGLMLFPKNTIALGVLKFA